MVDDAPNLQVRLFRGQEWALQSACVIQKQVDVVSNKRGSCCVMLTGGRSAERLYLAWRDLPEFRALKSAAFYFGDERCVSPTDPESNYGMAIRTLFSQGVPSGCSAFRMEADDADRERAAMRYEALLPCKIDILLLGVGEDGHVASLFPGSTVLGELCRRVVPVVGPKMPYERMTITPAVISSASSVFVLANGKGKAAVLHKIISTPCDHFTLPAYLVKDATWLLDTGF